MKYPQSHPHRFYEPEQPHFNLIESRFKLLSITLTPLEHDTFLLPIIPDFINRLNHSCILCMSATFP